MFILKIPNNEGRNATLACPIYECIAIHRQWHLTTDKSRLSHLLIIHNMSTSCGGWPKLTVKYTNYQIMTKCQGVSCNKLPFYVTRTRFEGIYIYDAYLLHIYNVLSIKIRVNVNGHVYVMWQNKSEQRMDEHNLGYLFSSHRCCNPGEALPHTWEGVQLSLHCCLTCINFNEIWKTLLTHWKCEIVILNRHFYPFRPCK